MKKIDIRSIVSQLNLPNIEDIREAAKKNENSIKASLVGIGAGVLSAGAMKKLTGSDKVATATGVAVGAGTGVLVSIALEGETMGETPEEFEEFEDCTEGVPEGMPEAVDISESVDSHLMVNTEALRDFCGSFADLAKEGLQYGLLHVLPEAIRSTIEKSGQAHDKDLDEIEWAINRERENVLDQWRLDDRTYEVWKRWKDTQTIEGITALEVHFLVDVAYEVVGEVTKKEAETMIPNRNPGPVMTPDELEKYHSAMFPD